MTFSHMPAVLASFCEQILYRFHVDTAARVPVLLLGILLAQGRRTVTSWFRAVDITAQFRQSYHALWVLGCKAPGCATAALRTALPCVLAQTQPQTQRHTQPQTQTRPQRLLFAIDDTPTSRYGPCVEGAGIHHNPSPGPAGQKYVYGHIWVSLALLGKHPQWDTLALPIRASLYVREQDIPNLPPERKRSFQTKLQLAAEHLAWLARHKDVASRERWVVADGAYAKSPFLKAARQHGFVVVSRLRKDAALFDLPSGQRKDGQRGPLPTYGKNKISLAELAEQAEGWQKVICVQYGNTLEKTVKTFLATWRPAGGQIRVVLVKEEDGTWLAFFCTDTEATAREILEAAADRGAIEQCFKDVKEVWGAGQQQVRNVDSNVGCFNANLWLMTLTEAWAWDKEAEELSGQRGQRCPWDNQQRRPSQADKRRAWQREVLREEIQGVLQGGPSQAEIRELVEQLLDLAA